MKIHFTKAPADHPRTDADPLYFGFQPSRVESGAVNDVWLKSVEDELLKIRGKRAQQDRDAEGKPPSAFKSIMVAVERGWNVLFGGEGKEPPKEKTPDELLHEEEARLERKRGDSYKLNKVSVAIVDRFTDFGVAAEKFLALARKEWDQAKAEGREHDSQAIERLKYHVMLAAESADQYDSVRGLVVESGGANGAYVVSGLGVGIHNRRMIVRSGDEKASWEHVDNPWGPWKHLVAAEIPNMAARFAVMGGDFDPFHKDTMWGPIMEIVFGAGLTAFVNNAPRMARRMFPRLHAGFRSKMATLAASILGGFIGGVGTWGFIPKKARGAPLTLGPFTLHPLLVAGFRAIGNCLVRYPVPVAINALLGAAMGDSGKQPKNKKEAAPVGTPAFAEA